jgi:hypothetical protein
MEIRTERETRNGERIFITGPLFLGVAASTTLQLIIFALWLLPAPSKPDDSFLAPSPPGRGLG